GSEPVGLMRWATSGRHPGHCDGALSQRMAEDGADRAVLLLSRMEGCRMAAGNMRNVVLPAPVGRDQCRGPGPNSRKVLLLQVFSESMESQGVR
ncbi:hypothetical protein, partial [Xanthobacter sediminis]|uniref:hypothetical protein n=1 Tax=Xanthobacter sediminis TaxID=3119926 RepID=UPI00372B72DC